MEVRSVAKRRPAFDALIRVTSREGAYIDIPMASLSSAASWLGFLATLQFLAVWTSGRLYAYFFFTEAEHIADFTKTVLPDSADPSVAKGFADKVIRAVLNDPERLTLLRIHVVAGTILTAIFLFNLTSYTRTSNYKRHKLLGAFSSIFALITMMYSIYILLFKGMVDMGRVVFWGDILSFIELAIFFPSAIAAILVGNVTRHRQFMIFACAGFFSNPIMRLFWVLFTKSELGGPLHSHKEFIDGPTNAAMYVTVFVNHAVAIYYAFFVPMHPKDVAREKLIRPILRREAPSAPVHGKQE